MQLVCDRLNLFVNNFFRSSRSERSPQSVRTFLTRVSRPGSLVACFDRISNELHRPVTHQDVATALVAATRSGQALRVIAAIECVTARAVWGDYCVKAGIHHPTVGPKVASLISVAPVILEGCGTICLNRVLHTATWIVELVKAPVLPKVCPCFAVSETGRNLTGSDRV